MNLILMFLAALLLNKHEEGAFMNISGELGIRKYVKLTEKVQPALVAFVNAFCKKKQKNKIKANNTDIPSLKHISAFVAQKWHNGDKLEVNHSNILKASKLTFIWLCSQLPRIKKSTSFCRSKPKTCHCNYPISITLEFIVQQADSTGTQIHIFYFFFF